MTSYLLSNDDGVLAPGLAALAEAVTEFGLIQIVAPSGNRSGYSNALTLDKPIRAHTLDNGAYSVDGTPADCVHLGMNVLMEPEPDMVISGINAGANLGDDVLYSGTVAAAMEGRFLGKPAIAVSLVGGSHEGTIEDYRPAAKVVQKLLARWDNVPLQPGTLLNVNVPSIAFESIKGLKATSLGHRARFNDVRPFTDPRGNSGYWLGVAGSGDHCGPGTDFHAVLEGYVSVTPLHADMTKYESKDDLAGWIEEF